MFDEVRIPRLVVAGAHSGAGKTTVTLGLVTALSRRDHVVQTFKVGPDLIDSAYLSHASRRPCRNLDAWMLGGNGLRRALAQGSTGADRAVIEGVMGIFDGHGLSPDEARASGAYPFPGSTAEVARLADSPVVLVLDVTAMGETAAAVALGVRQLDPNLRLIGVILNEVPSDYHRRLVEDAVWSLAKLPVLGSLPRMEAARIPELRMGLLPLTENPQVDAALELLGDAVERHCDLDLIERLMTAAQPLAPAPRPVVAVHSDSLRLGVAFDDAFCFYYPENLELLEDAGCEIVPFSPLDERSVPRDVDGLYFGGGFSDVFAPLLAANRPMLDSLKRAHQQGLPIYAEGGGTLLLSRSLRTGDGVVHDMSGVLPIDVALSEAPNMGYRDVRLMSDCLLGPAGTRLRGHEFHFSTLLTATDRFRAAYSMHDCDGEPLGCEGWTDPRLVASFVQLHFGQDPEIAARLVERLRAARRLRRVESAAAADRVLA
ncbi:MAG TPA: cobyrinate a,c-diamide synthase [Candidatus Angelobacter sp.]|jgi:cobyrinic acid a,c-diamide synthase|nr:cobyrinate a,c-diamide synthase [Candidatus Angelobacter sp.]